MTIYPAGDRALSADFGNQIDEKTNDQVMALAAALTEGKLPGIRELIPSYRALLVEYDPAVYTYEALAERIREAEKELGRTGTGNGGYGEKQKRIHLIPCCYGGEYGEDLAGLTELTGLSAEEIVRIHSGRDYKIYMLGFLPGFPYLGGMDSRIAAPRLDSPRVSIPAGSVGIGGSQTGIYPVASPGGWRLIGRTPVPLYDPDRDPPVLCRAGEYIRFVPIQPKEYDTIRADVTKGVWKAQVMAEDGGKPSERTV